jgi:hypothetical protein
MMKLRVHPAVDRVVLIRSVIGQGHDVPGLLVAQRLVVHGLGILTLPPEAYRGILGMTV